MRFQARTRTAALKTKSHFSAISPTYYIPYIPALIRPIKIFSLYFKDELQTLSTKRLKQQTKQTHVICHQFCAVAGAQPAPRAPLPDPAGPERLSRKALFLARRHVPTETGCKFYQICLGATLFPSNFILHPTPPPPPHHGIRAWGAEEGCARLARAAPGTG